MAAEQDTDFLPACFIDTGDYDLVKTGNDKRIIVLGRTGSGKSAALQMLERHYPQQVIKIAPENLALAYVSNSTILKFFAGLGVNLDPFFKLLWRHVITVELLSHHFRDRIDPKSPNLFSLLRDLFRSETQEDRNRQEAIDYLEKWGQRFWKKTEFRVKEITRSVESELEAAVGGKVAFGETGVSSSVLGTSKLSETEQGELKRRGQEVISQAQVRDLSQVLELIKGVFKDRMQTYFIVVDGLDEGWVEDRLRYRLIMALIATATDFLAIDGAKVMLALRRDLLDRVFRVAREAGFQEEKYRSLYIQLTWSKDDILAVLDKRIAHLVARQYTKEGVSHKDVFPKRFRNMAIDDFLFSVARRPRDIIAFFNTCVEVSPKRASFSITELKAAEGDYSQSRLKALADEWSADYPALLDFTRILYQRSESFKLGKVLEKDLEELCLQVAIQRVGQQGLLLGEAINVAEGMTPAANFRITLFRTFYKTGLIGLKLERHHTERWADDALQSVSIAEIDESTSAVVHPAYYRALGIGKR